MFTKENPVQWFEIPTKDISRAQKFYEKAFDCKLKMNEMDGLKMAWFPQVDDAIGATGTLVQGKTYTPSHDGSMVYFTVDNIETTLKTIEKAGGKTLNKKTSIGEYGFIAHFQDCEGNRVALHQNK